ncbi:MAG: GNAT family N-acetyltransferase [Clostridia bacterium]|nr:GNAT family N-acetyltransferase [Clostridia bacterium]
MLPKLDNHDLRIRYVPLRMERALDTVPEISLPQGYAFRFYREGDREAWIDIEKSAKEFTTYAEGLESWARYYGAHEAELSNRMLFIEDYQHTPVATATAFYDVPNGDPAVDGCLHWVAVRREAQGRGLSKPLVARTLRQLKALGYAHTLVPTQTTTWLACKVYLDLGFRPTARSLAEDAQGWRILRRLTNHAALKDIEPATDEEVLCDA